MTGNPLPGDGGGGAGMARANAARERARMVLMNMAVCAIGWMNWGGNERPVVGTLRRL